MKLFFSSKRNKNEASAATGDDSKPEKPVAPPPETPSPAVPGNDEATGISPEDDFSLLLGESTDLSALLGSSDSPEIAGTEAESRDAAQPDPVFVPANAEDVLYRRLLNGLYDGVLLVDAKGTVFCSNRRAEKFFGYSDDEFWNMPVERLIRGVNAKVLFKIRMHTESGRFTVISAICKCKDDSTFPAEIAINHLGLFNQDDMIFSIRNVARRERSRQQQELRDDAVRGTGSAIVICNTEGLIEMTNPAFVRMTGSPSEQDLLKRYMGDFFTANETVNAMLRTPSGSGTWMGNLELLHQHDNPRSVLAVANLAPERPHTPARLVVTLTPLPRAAAMRQRVTVTASQAPGETS